MSSPRDQLTPEQRGPVGRLLGWCLANRLIVVLGVLAVVGVGLSVAPFDWALPLPRRPVATDAIPDIGENQQIIFTRWPGRSPQDVQDQISYPLSTALQGIDGVETIRSLSMFGFSTIYLIFEEDMGFDASRSRILEKLESLQAGEDYPEGTSPQLGPDATALGQIFWYTLEGRDPTTRSARDPYGKPVGGWDLEELRTVQDWFVRYALAAADGVSEVASVGGFVREYQVDVNPDAMRHYEVSLEEVAAAVRHSNVDVGAKTLEFNNVEYFPRGVGFIESVEDIRKSVVTVRDHVPVLVENVADVHLGPALRRGVLDKDGAEAVGGVVVARYGENPLMTIKSVKAKIEQVRPGLPAKVLIDEATATEDVRAFAAANGFEAYDEAGELNQDVWLKHLRGTPREAWPAWVTISQVTIVPFYDRTELIYETLGTLRSALTEQILVTFIVVVIMVVHLRSSMLIGGMLPLAVLLCFIAMKLFGVDANIVALSGIAIAIGTIVDMGIVISENILRHLEDAPADVPRRQVIHRAASEVGSAVLTAVATTVVSFLPVFTMAGQEGKLFRPLAFTKTFALIASILIALTVLPAAAELLFCSPVRRRRWRARLYGGLAGVGVLLAGYGVGQISGLWVLAGVALAGWALAEMARERLPEAVSRRMPWIVSGVVAVLVTVLLASVWEPLGPQRGMVRNGLFVGLLIGGLLGGFKLFIRAYPWLLRRVLAHKVAFISLVGVVMLLGVLAWRGWEATFGWLADAVPAVDLRSTTAWVGASQRWPGLGRQFMPDLDEGAFLFMPTTSAHASIGQAREILARQDMAFHALPEVEQAVGKIGRAETPLDPAPVSMIETIITYKPEFRTDASGRRVKYRIAEPGAASIDDQTGRAFAVDTDGELIPDDDGSLFRNWRPEIRSPEDVWDAIVEAGDIPGTTRAPRLMPIKARIVMLQSGMRAPMGVKIQGPDLLTIEQVGLQIERLLKKVPGVQPDAVQADRIIGKPYLEIIPDRQALARYGVKMADFQDVVAVAVGGRTVTWTVMGRQRFAVRVRYQRERRDSIEALGRILVAGKDGSHVPLEQLASIRYVRGPQVIKSEETFLVGYVLFDKLDGEAEIDVVERAKAYLEANLNQPAGVKISFAGNYINQLRSQRTLAIVLPVALAVIFLILYVQFKSVVTTLLVFSGIFVAWAGGFVLLWLYGEAWFLDLSVFGAHMRDVFQVETMTLTVAVWVGFLALFGIATDNGVIQSTYLDQVFRERQPDDIQGIRDATVEAAERRIRPCLMTTATTILALIPVLTSTGRGSDVMVPMAIPSFGGMLVVVLSVFVVPVLYCWVREGALKRGEKRDA
ncbi:MAG: AcrB/AcrD/AcrF family protein [Planctomycetes bacterium]|nr:AcrB/AcrD/AcrF family protein [Planctomycetota bacterium]